MVSAAHRTVQPPLGGIAPYKGIVAILSNSRAVPSAEMARDGAYVRISRTCEAAAALLQMTAPIFVDVRRSSTAAGARVRHVRRQYEAEHGYACDTAAGGSGEPDGFSCKRGRVRLSRPFGGHGELCKNTETVEKDELDECWVASFRRQQICSVDNHDVFYGDRSIDLYDRTSTHIFDVIHLSHLTGGTQTLSFSKAVLFSRFSVAPPVSQSCP